MLIVFWGASSARYMGVAVEAKVTLAEALMELRRELYAAQDDGAGQQLRFEVEQAQLTLDVEFRRGSDGKVKVEVGFPGVKAGAEASGRLEATHRQTLTLSLQVHDEALGGSRAKIRRPSAEDNAGATVAKSTGAEASEQSTGAEVLDGASGSGVGAKRPWER
ncbi:trypco2 family protein [Streptomyces sp. NBC_01451]|uniref:trypco2 family protein n=1 Tax=Streptomyces sp. NBC_01451 TaxID=2903872 RepID=UPI002E32F14A|nr:trypco2 family protein [Streptomyces sp. NBC_01451]